VNIEKKVQSRQWMHTHPPNRPGRFKQMLSARKLMATVFWERRGVLMVEIMQQGTTTSEVYCKTLKKLCRAIQNKRRGMLTYGVALHHDNARLHTAAHTQALPELFDHMPYSPDFAPIDYNLFTYLKNWLQSQCFNNNEDLTEDVKMWLSS
jgi:transposase